MIAAIASSGVCLADLHHVNGAGSNFLDMFSNLGSPYGACFLMNKFAFHKCSTEGQWVRFRVQRATFLPMEPPEEALDPGRRHLARKPRRASTGTFHPREEYVPEDEGSFHESKGGARWRHRRRNRITTPD